MSIHKFSYGVESLQNDKTENLEKEFESQTKLTHIDLLDFSDKLEKFNNLQNTEGALRVEEIQFNNGETNILINAKLFLDINKSIEDIKIILKNSEQDIKNKLPEKKKEIILDAAKEVEEQQVILRNHFERNLILDLEKSKNQAVKNVIQFIYNKGLFDSFGNKEQIFESYLTLGEEYLMEK